ncbi:hypothetical protein A2153_04685 [Candidatus Gottesmanbacteria bacterium RBG_16_38_7b]|uniref:Glycosyltransferase RgtA/B/C/D-like domain-containing protein n=1 Tax=Candidatus Gottesmanbacteria bacterium RBG_16_38_7b TaxID=1798372 RepID=A0A1F5YF60_9BACT|nr:MAG: hypothetical protein A2153_04685 [Candidatus Gottesmanbacteria bacterium RBG_16_38_7b]
MKQKLILATIVVLALFLRINRLEQNLIFTGETGQTYLEVRDALIDGKLPLRGLSTSHSWLSFGPWYYYLLMVSFKLFGYHPNVPAYMSALFSTAGVILVYLAVKESGSKRKSMVAALLAATSPAYLTLSRDGRFYTLAVYLALAVFIFAVKYNRTGSLNRLEIFLGGLSLGLAVSIHWSGLIIFPGLLWILIKNKNRIKAGWGALGFLLPFIPFLIYDARHSFSMTGKILAWLPYRILTTIGIINTGSFRPGSSEIFTAITEFFQSVVNPIGLKGAVLTAIFCVYSILLIRRKDIIGMTAIFLWGGIISIMLHGQPPLHYFAPVLPFAFLLYADFIGRLVLISRGTFWRAFSLIMLSGLFFFQAKFLFSDKWFYIKQAATGDKPVPYALQEDLAKKIVNEAAGKEYSLKRVGPFDIYRENFSQNYRYLMWMYGNEPLVGRKTNLVYTIYDDPKGLPLDADPSSTIRAGNIMAIREDNVDRP